jgi:hypothetical protein
MAQEEAAAAIDGSQMHATSDAVPEAPIVNAAEESVAERKRLPPGQRTYRKVELPTAEQMAQDEFMNNCGTRTVLSAVMGSGLGVLFGIFMGTMETSVRNSAIAADFKFRISHFLNKKSFLCSTLMERLAERQRSVLHAK